VSARRPVRTVAAVDLGAESGRVVRVDFDGEHLGIREISRFTHTPVTVHGILRREPAAARLREMTQDDDRQRGLIPT
jgi:hypothetical protein